MQANRPACWQPKIVLFSACLEPSCIPQRMRLRDTHKSVIAASNEQKTQIAGDVTDKAVLMAMFLCLRQLRRFQTFKLHFQTRRKNIYLNDYNELFQHISLITITTQQFPSSQADSRSSSQKGVCRLRNKQSP
jgi:hypothetical protein